MSPRSLGGLAAVALVSLAVAGIATAQAATGSATSRTAVQRRVVLPDVGPQPLRLRYRAYADLDGSGHLDLITLRRISPAHGQITATLVSGRRVSITTDSTAVALPALVATGNVDGYPGDELFVDVEHISTNEFIGVYTYRDGALHRAATLAGYSAHPGLWAGMTCVAAGRAHTIVVHQFVEQGTGARAYWTRQDTVYTWSGPSLRHTSTGATRRIYGLPPAGLVGLHCGHAPITARTAAGPAATVIAAATAGGTWRTLPTAPPPRPTPLLSAAAWTGHAFVLFGRIQPHPPTSKDVALAYTPQTGTWRTLHPFSGPPGNFQGSYRALWTGRQVLVFQPQDTQAYTPASARWSRLRQEPAGGGEDGLVAWTGHELIDWGGGCCEDALATGAALNPSTGRWRILPVAPLAPSNSPIGVWTGRELLVFVTGLDPDGHPYPAPLARAAAYDPATNTWRRIAPIPSPRRDETVVWDGHEVLAVGGYRATGISAEPILLASALAYTPASNRWRTLAPMPAARAQFAAVWTGHHLLVWGGTRAASSLATATGLSYDPASNRWTALPAAPLRPALAPIAVWTGSSMLVWTGSTGAIFTPTAR